MYLSLIIPAYNEENRIGKTLEKVFAYLASQPYESEVIIVDDGSIDNSVQVIRNILPDTRNPTPDTRPETRLIEHKPNRGKGAAVKAGMLAATGAIRIFTDADLSTPIHEVEKVI